MADRRVVSVLGSTGSVGQSTLAVVQDNPDFEVFALSANSNVELLHQQCLKHEPVYAVLSTDQAAAALTRLLQASACRTEVLSGGAGLEAIASDSRVDTVMAAIVGAAGLAPTLAAAGSGKRVLLANKEALVMSGELFMARAAASGAMLIPIDSEHNAVFQCLPAADGDSGRSLANVDKVALTASGGPFLHLPLEKFPGITPRQAVAHPNWNMGPKISVDSATMMNKGLEVIEASYLFALGSEQIEVVIHPQSIVHSMVYYRDGSVLAQLANPDMRVPIAHGLAFPERMASGAATLDLTRLHALEFFAPDLERFPCLRLGMEAARAGGTAPTVLNAANEEAVSAFLEGRVRFHRIPLIIEEVLSKIPCETAASLDIIRGTDERARSLCKELIIKEIN